MAGITHQWNGTILTITSDSGTSSCDLKGEKGDDGARGAMGLPGDANLIVAVEKMENDIEQSNKYNVNDISLLDGVNVRKNISGNVSFQWDTEKRYKCHVEGTAATTESANIISSTAKLPTPIKAGESYYLYFKSTDKNIVARIYQYNANGSVMEEYSHSSLVVIKADTIGLIVRISVPSGNTANGDVEIAFLNGVPNEDMLETAYLTPTGGREYRDTNIEEMLKKYGVCKLGAGTYYISSIDMPQGSMLIGSGNATKLICLGMADSRAIIMAADCAVKDLQLIGAETDITPAATIGNRHGIMWQGNRSTANDNIPVRGLIDGVSISNFDGGGITCNDTGYGVDGGLRATNCYIRNCGAGINIPYWAEFNRFTNVNCNYCYYGVINNGGNNFFINCGLDRNTIGFLLDNEDDKSPNNAHGSVIGCSINHSTEYAIKIIRTYNGYVFNGIQLFDGAINIDRSMGIIFGNCEFGKDIPITITSGQLVLFNGCMFTNAPVLTITSNTQTKFVNTYDRFGVEVGGT